MVKKYLSEYDKQSFKNFFTTYIAFFILGMGIPLMVTFFLKEEYSYLTWVDNVQMIILTIGSFYTLSMFISYVCKEKKKLYSLFLFEVSQFLYLELFGLAAFIGFIVMFDDWLMKIVFSVLYLAGVLKVYLDVKKKHFKQFDNERIMTLANKFGGAVFLLIIVGRWIVSFIFPSTEKFSIIGALSPLILVILFVYMAEYAIGKLIEIKQAISGGESYRIELGLNKKEWYGSKSKEYKAESKQYQ